MKISELSERSDLPIATVKIYLRERLLPPGKRLTRNLSAYSETHLERLKIVCLPKTSSDTGRVLI